MVRLQSGHTDWRRAVHTEAEQEKWRLDAGHFTKCYGTDRFGWNLGLK